MAHSGINRRDFLKKTTALAAFSALASIQQTLGQKINSVSAKSLNRSDYMLDPKITYFNHGSIGTMPRALHEAHVKYLQLCETNPWYYMWNDPWKIALKETRKKVAQFLNCDSDELAFTHNTTEGFNLIAQGLNLKQNDEVLFSTLNHPGASICWQHHSGKSGYKVRSFKFPMMEVPNLSAADVVSLYEKQISDKTSVLAIPHIDNIIGLRYPIKEIAAMAHRKGVKYVAVDGAQAIGMIPFDLADSGVDIYAASPHKWLQAPKGTGLLYVKKELQKDLKAMWVTWGQERFKGTVRIFEDYGTRNLAEVLTLGDCIDFQNKVTMDASIKQRKDLWSYVKSAVESSTNLSWRSPDNWDLGCSLYGIGLKEKSSDLAKRLFKEHGYVFRPFHSDNWNTIRLSLNLINTKEEVDRLIELIG